MSGTTSRKATAAVMAAAAMRCGQVSPATSSVTPSMGGMSTAALGDCSQPLSNGVAPVSTDCLFILNAAVTLVTCSPECICAPSGTLPISATDALVCLRKAVGQDVPLDCPCDGGETSTTSSTRLETTTTLLDTVTTTTLGLVMTSTLAPVAAVGADGRNGDPEGDCEVLPR